MVRFRIDAYNRAVLKIERDNLGGVLATPEPSRGSEDRRRGAGERPETEAVYRYV